MTLRRICTINGRSYAWTGNCPVCENPMWTTTEDPTHHAGCTSTHCLQEATSPEPNPLPVTPVVTHDPIAPSHDTDEDDDPSAYPV
jgi:hypothetical protein